jgi:hypothetical protein
VCSNVAPKKVRQILVHFQLKLQGKGCGDLLITSLSLFTVAILCSGGLEHAPRAKNHVACPVSPTLPPKKRGPRGVRAIRPGGTVIRTSRRGLRAAARHLRRTRNVGRHSGAVRQSGTRRSPRMRPITFCASRRSSRSFTRYSTL